MAQHYSISDFFPQMSNALVPPCVREGVHRIQEDPTVEAVPFNSAIRSQ